MERDIVAFYMETLRIEDRVVASILASHTELRAVKKREVFHRVGEVPQTMDFLVEGLVRGFFPDGTGKEVTDCFEHIPGTPLVSGLSIGAPSVISIEALSKVTLASVPLSFLATLMEEPAVLKVVIRCLSASLERHWEQRRCWQSALQKSVMPGSSNGTRSSSTVSNDQYIASFLGCLRSRFPGSVMRWRRRNGLLPVGTSPEMGSDGSGPGGRCGTSRRWSAL